MDAAWMVMPAALVMDLVVGDPQGWPHPVRWMGRAIDGMESYLRQFPLPPVLAGGVMVLVLVAGVWAITAGLLIGLYWIHPLASTAAEILVIAWLLSVRSLYDAGMAVYAAFSKAGILGARQAVAMIVGRETESLDEAGVSRAAVESVAENLVDGVVSPLFFAALGGAPLAAAYKMVNTLDSMIGYRNDRYEQFGKVAARVDDAANFLPARLSVAAVALAARMLGTSGRSVMRLAWQDGRNAASPNAGYPEAAFAAALQVRLGGPAAYHGRRMEKPFIGAHHRIAVPADIPRACILMVMSSIFAALAAMVVQWLR
jgi:adenosylcobinamide-phosphate synthase